MAETLLFSENFESYTIPVIYGTSKLYGTGYLYGGSVVSDWLRPAWSVLANYVNEDFEDSMYDPPVWSQSLDFSEDFEGLWV
jgi:hypothetical protein